MAIAVSSIRSAFSWVREKRQLKLHDVVANYAAFEFALVLVIGSAVMFAYPYETMNWSQGAPDFLMPSLFAAVILVGGSTLRDHYNRSATKGPLPAVSCALTASLRSSAALVALLFFIHAQHNVSRGSLLCHFIVVTLAVAISRGIFSRWAHLRLASHQICKDRTIVVGERSRITFAREALSFFDRLRRDGVRVVSTKAWQAGDKTGVADPIIKDVVEQSRAGQIDSVIVLPTPETAALAEQVIGGLTETPLTVHVVPFASQSGASAGATNVGGQASILIANSPMHDLWTMAKRLLDISVSLMMLFLLSPLFIAVATAIKLESPGPIFFRQTRHGYGNCFFKVFKFRSMCVMEDGAAFRQATRNDTRITRIGRFIRRTNIDELPQLLNVLRGEMSLVGPRPHPVALNDTFASRIRVFHRRHNIRPGITGWAQVNGYRGETDTDDKMAKRVEHDLWYLDHWSFYLDLRILIMTLFSARAYQNAG